jgi:PAS domain S-box-containing protein
VVGDAPGEPRPTQLDAEQIVDFVREAMLVLDGELRILIANRPFYEKFEVVRAETIGKSIYELGSGQWNIVELRSLLARVLEDGTAFEGFQVTHQFERIGERRIVLNARKVHQSGDGVDLVLLAFEDLTRRTVAERRMGEYEDRFRLIFESVKDFSIFTTDLNGTIDSWNTGAENVFGYEETEILGCPFETIFTTEDRALGAHVTELAKAARDGRAVDERWHLKKDGSRFWASGMVTPLTDEDGAIVGFTKVARDITERKRAEQLLEAHAAALREEHRRKDEFLAMLAHELRNPLAAIGGTTHLFRIGAEAEADLQWGREVIDRQVAQLTRLIDDLLDVSRISTGKIYLKKEPLDFRDVIANACEASRPLIEAKRHALSVFLPTEPLRVDGDPARLQQVIGNIVANAAKYTDEAGQITVSAIADGANVEVEVLDNGVGISPEMLPEIFSLFTQVDGSLGRAQGGLGIGLSLVKTLVEMHEGAVVVASDGPGLGSRFTVRLPLMTDDRPLSAGANAVRIGDSPLMMERKYRILVVDDNVDTARGMARILKLSGHDVRVTADGPSALTEAGEFLPEIVLLDIGLPGMTGHDVARELRCDRRLAKSTFIAVSGYGQEKDLKEARDSGFNHHMIKPVDVDRLLELIARL